MDIIRLNAAITELPFRIVSAYWQSEDNKLSISVEMYESTETRDSGTDPLVTRTYHVPLPDATFEASVKQVLKQAVDLEGKYQLELGE